MNRSLIAAVVIGLVLVVCAVANANDDEASVSNREKRHGYKRRCGWWGRPCCKKYNKDEKYCCRRLKANCCSKYALYDKPNCTSAVEYFPDRCDCTKFYQCFGGNLTHFSCPLRGAWDQSSTECKKVMKNPPEFCERRPFRLTYFPGLYANYTMRIVNGSSGAVLSEFTDSAPRDAVYNIMAYFAGSRTDFSFTSSFNVIFWYFINCINGVCASSADMTFWQFSINGVVSNLGVSSVIANNGDVIGFTLVKY